MTENMIRVYNECVAVADSYGEYGYFCVDEVSVQGITKNQMKGYLSQLVQAGKIEIFDEESYFDARIVNWE